MAVSIDHPLRDALPRATAAPQTPPTAPPVRRRSRAVRSALLGSVAVSFLAACGDDDLARCIDQGTSEIVDVSRCDNDTAGRYFWNFGGTSDDTRVGTKVDGGENVRPSDSAGIAARGGFGENAQTSGTGVRQLASTSSGDDSDGKKKSSSSSSSRSSGG